VEKNNQTPIRTIAPATETRDTNLLVGDHLNQRLLKLFLRKLLVKSVIAILQARIQKLPNEIQTLFQHKSNESGAEPLALTEPL
jgi:hypothetical protein